MVNFRKAEQEHLMSAGARSLKDEIEAESTRILKEFMPYLEREIERAADRRILLLCLSQQDKQPEYFPCQQAERSNLSEIISVLQAEARLNGLILPYAYENLAVISNPHDREEFARQIDSAREIISRHSFGRVMAQEQITMSFGVSSYPFDSEYAYELLLQAGLALQKARESGGNALCCYWRLP